jgi:hypothetical protein
MVGRLDLTQGESVSVLSIESVHLDFLGVRWHVERSGPSLGNGTLLALRRAALAPSSSA